VSDTEIDNSRSERPSSSFVMPVYNAGTDVLRSLESISQQTDPDFEIVVVDDGSNDGTSDLLNMYAARERRMRLFRQDNAGITRALIRGCDAARGRYIVRHDAGDVSHVRRLAMQREALERTPALAFVSCWTQVTGPAFEELFVSRGSGAARQPTHILDVNRPALVTDGPAHHGSVMFRRDAYLHVGGYRGAFYYGQDWDLWYRLAETGQFQMIEAVLYTAVITPSSISSSAKSAQDRVGRLVHESVRARHAGKNDTEFLAAALRIGKQPGSRCATARGNYFIGESLRRNGDTRATKYLREAVARCPIFIRAWIRLLQALLFPS
jgi:glycosyltransferase involved in cell wall biosynthesis